MKKNNKRRSRENPCQLRRGKSRGSLDSGERSSGKRASERDDSL